MHGRKVLKRAHASTVLLVVGLLVSVIGCTGFTFWHRVAQESGPNMSLTGIAVTIVEIRKMGWKQALLQSLLLAPLFILVRDAV
jgi:hypothetical protein